MTDHALHLTELVDKNHGSPFIFFATCLAHSLQTIVFAVGLRSRVIQTSCPQENSILHRFLFIGDEGEREGGAGVIPIGLTRRWARCKGSHGSDRYGLEA